MSDDYERLVEKVDSATSAVAERRARDLACRKGCAGCCHVELTIARVEAERVARAFALLPDAVRAEAHARAEAPPDGRCVMLDAEDACIVHGARPLVCRTQGLPLLYPEGVIPVDAVRLRTSRGDATICPLNFTDSSPAGEDLIDAARIDTMLALIDRLDAEAKGHALESRIAIRELARGDGPGGV